MSSPAAVRSVSSGPKVSPHASRGRWPGPAEQAEQLYQRALSLRESHLGPHHPDIAETQHDGALLRQKQSKLGEALSLAERALLIRCQTLGEAHPKTIATRTLHTQLLQEQAVSRTKRRMEALKRVPMPSEMSN